MSDWSDVLLWCALQVTLLCTTALGAQFFLCHKSRAAAVSFGTLVAIAVVTLVSIAFQPRWNRLAELVPSRADLPETDTEGAESQPSSTIPPRTKTSPRDRQRPAPIAAVPETRPSGISAAPSTDDEKIVEEVEEAIADSTPVATRPPVSPELSELPRTSGDGPSVSPLARSSEQPAVRIWPRILVGFMVGASALGFGRLLVGLAMLVLLVRRSRRLDDERLTQVVRELRQRLGLRRRVSLRESDSMSTAATFSWPATILLPVEWRDWDDATLQAVLAHELAHIQRRDFSRWMLAQCSLVMHYYHPLVHYLASRFRLQQELAADVLASEIIGDRDLYRNLLGRLALAQPKHSLPRMATAFLPREATILRRIEMLAQPRTIFFLPSVRQAIALAVVALAAFGVVGLRGTSERTLAQSTTPSASTKQTGESEKKDDKTKIPWESLIDGVWDIKTAIWSGPGNWKPTAEVDRFSLAFSKGKYYLLETRGDKEKEDVSIVEQGTVVIGRRDGPIARLSFVRAGSTRRTPVWGLAITDEQMDLMWRQHVPYNTYGTFTIVKRKADDPSVQDVLKKLQSEHQPKPPSSQEVFELLIRDTKPTLQGRMVVASPEIRSPSLYVRCAKCHSPDWKSRRLSFSYVPLDAAFVTTFRAARLKLMKRPVGAALLRQFKTEPLLDQTSTILQDASQLTLVSLVWKSSSEHSSGMPDPSLLIAYLKTPYSKEKTQETFRPILGEMEHREVGQQQYWRSKKESEPLCLWRSDDGKTLILAMNEGALLRALAAGPEGPSGPKWLGKASSYLAQSLIPGAGPGRPSEEFVDFHAWYGLSSYYSRLPDGTTLDCRIVADVLVYAPFFRSFSKEMINSPTTISVTRKWPSEATLIAMSCHDGIAAARIGREKVQAAAALFAVSPNRIYPPPSTGFPALAGREPQVSEENIMSVRARLASLFRQLRASLTSTRIEVSRHAGPDTLERLRSLDALESMLDSVVAVEGARDDNTLTLTAMFPVSTLEKFLSNWRLMAPPKQEEKE